jgi:exodeoxyribonuclease V beta subunit
MSAEPWQDCVDLPPATTWLLEASAGTGKTYQIASLFLRLVAEYGVPVEKILAISFTNAATAELRDRIRGRLRDALATLRAPAATTEDPVLARLRSLERRAEIDKRIDLALRSFDLAPISTIHGFSQRILKELAFDSGQDPDLELLSDVSEVLEQIVDDTLASVYAQASPGAVVLLEDLGFTRGALLKVAREMTGPTEPSVVPVTPEDLPAHVRRAIAWAADTAALRDRWGGDEHARALGQLQDDARRKRVRGRADWIASSARDVGAWLARGAGEWTASEASRSRLIDGTLRGSFEGSPEELAGRAWTPALQELEAFVARRDAVQREVAPLAAFARTVRARVEAELSRRRALSFDGMLSRLADRVTRDGGAESPIATRIRERFLAAFVDEFQDTDDAQWRVIEAAFHGHGRLFLIGDPKQAIYGFRGADVHVYLAASRVVDERHRRTMVHNWRSDPQAVEAMNALWRESSLAFDQEHIDYVEVSATRPDRLVPGRSGLELRWLDDRVRGGADGEPVSSKIDGVLARLAAREVVGWLRGERSRIGRDADTRAVQPADLAVLVNSHNEARRVRLALRRAGVPAVAASKDSVFDTVVAGWLAAWLDAVAGGGRDRAARTAVVTPLFGWSGDELAWALAVATRGDEARREARAAGVTVRDWDVWTERLRAAGERWSKHGFARTFDREAVDGDVYPRVLGLVDGERHATDLRHLFELAHVEQRARHWGPRALADWLRAEVGARAEETAQRLESDARAVTIETVHASKGLEYPIVLLPYASSARAEKDAGDPIVVRGSARPELNVASRETNERGDARDRYATEQRREALRKLYVGLTRARHHTVAWYGPIGENGARTSATPLGRLLMRDPTGRGFDDDAMPAFDGDDPRAWTAARQRLDELVAHGGGTISWSAETAPEATLPRWTPGDTDTVELRTGPWPRGRSVVSHRWVVTSFSGLGPATGAHDRDEKLPREAPHATLEEGATAASEDARDEATLRKPPLESFTDCARLKLGGGTEYGSWVHKVLEQIDFRAVRGKDGQGLREVLLKEGARFGFKAGDPTVSELEARLPSVLATPLDAAHAGDPVRGLPAGFTLGHIDPGDRLDEIGFDLRIGDGTAWRRDPARSPGERSPLERCPGCASPRAVYEAIFSTPLGHSSGATPWIEHQRTRLADGAALIGSIAGILTGSIDLVFRAKASGATRYFLVDYKTNRIETSEPGHYAAPWLAWKMAGTAYPLQALIYTLALHRHLRVRLRDYDYDTHVGGYLYLFLRGVSGPETPRWRESDRCLGVFGDRWPKRVVEALDLALCPGDEAAR